jgi:hypothetical protein
LLYSISSPTEVPESTVTLFGAAFTILGFAARKLRSEQGQL